MIRLVPALILNLLLTAGAFRKGSVSAGGAFTGFFLGFIIYVSGGAGFWIILVAFFVSSSLLSRIGSAKKAASSRIHERGDRRDWVQVLANGGVGAFFSLLYLLTGEQLCAAAFAAANADTWASEIGVLSERPPVSILDGRELAPGTSGGVSRLGFIAAASGSAMIGFIYLFMGLFSASPLLRLLPEALMITAGGFFGAWMDSLIGATVQAKYLCSVEGTETERRRSGGVDNSLIRGMAFMTNDTVNFLSGLVSTGAAVLLISCIPGI